MMRGLEGQIGKSIIIRSLIAITVCILIFSILGSYFETMNIWILGVIGIVIGLSCFFGVKFNIV
jgi:hypothetical protein